MVTFSVKWESTPFFRVCWCSYHCLLSTVQSPGKGKFTSGMDGISWTTEEKVKTLALRIWLLVSY